MATTADSMLAGAPLGICTHQIHKNLPEGHGGGYDIVNVDPYPVDWERDFPLAIPTAPLLQRRIEAITQQMQWAFQKEYKGLTTSNIQQLIQDLGTMRPIRSVSDRSTKDGKSATARCTILSNGSQIGGGFKVLGPDQDQDLYWAEVAGLLATTMLLRCCQQHFHLPICPAIIGSDSLGALKRLLDNNQPMSSVTTTGI